MAIKLNVAPKLVVLTRRKVLHYVIAEVTQKLFENNSELGAIFDTLQKGIVEREIIQKQNVIILDKNNEVVLQLVFSIDWEKHRVNAMTTEGATFEVNKDKSVAEQVLSVSDQVSQLLDDAIAHHEDCTLIASYTYKSEIRANPEAYKEAKEFLNHIDSPEKKWKEGTDWDLVQKYIPKDLNELSIDIKAKQ